MPYVHDVRHVARVLGFVANATTPGTVTAEHLAANGFPEPAGTQVWHFLHALGFVQSDGRPTDLWTGHRVADDRKKALGTAVRDVYAPLVELSEDGSSSDSDLEAVVTSDDPEHAGLVVATFKALAACAGIDLQPSASPLRSRREVLRDVSDLLQRSVTEFEQARQCLAYDLTRPAHVAAWNSFTALALAHLADNDFAALRVNRRRAALPLDELVRVVHGGELVRLVAEHQLVAADDKDLLGQMLRQRNDCAHPMSFEPDRTATAAYLSAILSLSAQLTDPAISTDSAAPSMPPPPTTPR
jgi:hypothetical protein